MDNIAGVDQSSHDLSTDAESEVALHACADDAGEFLARALTLSGACDLHQRRFRAGIGARPSTPDEQPGHDAKDSGCSCERPRRHEKALHDVAVAGTSTLDAFHS